MVNWKRTRRLIALGLALTMLFLLVRWNWHTRAAARAHLPLPALKLSADQARAIEDWAEANPLAEDDETSRAYDAAREEMVRRVLTPEQHRTWSAMPGPARCLNPFCVAHGRVSSPAHIAGWLSRHMRPADIALVFDVRAGGRAAWAESVVTLSADPPPPPAVQIYICKAGEQPPPGLAARGLAPLPAPSYSAAAGPRGWRGFACINLPEAKRIEAEEVIRQALVIDHGRIRRGLRADLALDASAPPCRVGQPVLLRLTVSNVGDDPDWSAPYLGPETPPPGLVLTVVTPDGARHELESAARVRSGPEPAALGWGYARSRTADLLAWPGAAEIFSRPGAYILSGAYAPKWPDTSVRLATAPLTLKLADAK